MGDLHLAKGRIGGFELCGASIHIPHLLAELVARESQYDELVRSKLLLELRIHFHVIY